MEQIPSSTPKLPHETARLIPDSHAFPCFNTVLIKVIAKTNGTNTGTEIFCVNPGFHKYVAIVGPRIDTENLYAMDGVDVPSY